MLFGNLLLVTVATKVLPGGAAIISPARSKLLNQRRLKVLQFPCDIESQDCVRLYGGDRFGNNSCVPHERLGSRAICGGPGAPCITYGDHGQHSTCGNGVGATCVNGVCQGGLGMPCNISHPCNYPIQCGQSLCGGPGARVLAGGEEDETWYQAQCIAGAEKIGKEWFCANNTAARNGVVQPHLLNYTISPADTTPLNVRSSASTAPLASAQGSGDTTETLLFILVCLFGVYLLTFPALRRHTWWVSELYSSLRQSRGEGQTPSDSSGPGQANTAPPSASAPAQPNVINPKYYTVLNNSTGNTVSIHESSSFLPVSTTPQHSSPFYSSQYLSPLDLNSRPTSTFPTQHSPFYSPQYPSQLDANQGYQRRGNTAYLYDPYEQHY